MNERKFGALSSSVNPQELSLTVSSISKVLIGLVGWFAVSKGLDPAAAQTQLQAIVDIMAQAVPLCFTLFNSLQTVWGLVRKLITYFAQK